VPYVEPEEEVKPWQIDPSRSRKSWSSMVRAATPARGARGGE
jgi:hypothetical protein